MALNNLIYCSTGTMIGRINNWDESLIYRFCPLIRADGFELMMVKAFYDKRDRVISAVKKSGCKFPLIHFEKEIGIYLASPEREDKEKALELFRFNCEVGKEIGAERCVFHLWSGIVSDTALENNLSMLDELYSICEEHSLTLLIENVPCASGVSPLSNLKRIRKIKKDAGFVYDTRFGALHGDNRRLYEKDFFEKESIVHLHVSGYGGPVGDFSSLRPILHLHEGIVDYSLLLPSVFASYNGSVTNESPGAREIDCDLDAINDDIRFLRCVSTEGTAP